MSQLPCQMRVLSQSQSIEELRADLQQVATKVMQIANGASLSKLAAPPSLSLEQQGNCNGSLLFWLQPYTFAPELAKVAFTMNHLTDRARVWEL